jgi:hypothetical protein
LDKLATDWAEDCDKILLRLSGASRPETAHGTPVGWMFKKYLHFGTFVLAQLSQIEGGEPPGTFIIRYQSAYSSNCPQRAERVGRKAPAKNPESTRNEAPQKAPLPMCKQERSSLRGEELGLLIVDRLDHGHFRAAETQIRVFPGCHPDGILEPIPADSVGEQKHAEDQHDRSSLREL